MWSRSGRPPPGPEHSSAGDHRRRRTRRRRRRASRTRAWRRARGASRREAAGADADAFRADTVRSGDVFRRVTDDDDAALLEGTRSDSAPRRAPERRSSVRSSAIAAETAEREVRVEPAARELRVGAAPDVAGAEPDGDSGVTAHERDHVVHAGEHAIAVAVSELAMEMRQVSIERAVDRGLVARAGVGDEPWRAIARSVMPANDSPRTRRPSHGGRRTRRPSRGGRRLRSRRACRRCRRGGPCRHGVEVQGTK